ncbi:isoleucine--tRNA ligase [Patescibacteria group bacterium]
MAKYFEDVDLKVNFSKAEKELMNHWYDEGVVEKYLKRNKSSRKYFSFIDGPITANNPMGVHHGWGRTYKDLWQRYKNMQGYRQRFQNGFDSQGLWVEVEVEKELGFKSKKDIEEYGVEKFVNKCKERVKKYSQIQTEQSKRLGYFMDWNNSYYTMSRENNFMIWQFLKTCHENGWLYKGNESVPWCPRCETAISQHEILSENYDEVTHESVYFRLPVKGKENEYFLVWTTTPWTIPANIALAVDKNIVYSLVEKSGEGYWVASDLVQKIFGKNSKVIKKSKGKELVGLTYHAPFDDLPAVSEVALEHPDNFHIVVATEDRIMPISTDEGTGIVHTAVSAGTEDFKLGKKLNLPMIPVIKDDASYFDGFGELSGKNAKEDPLLVLNFMRSNKKNDKNWVFKIEEYTHRYPRCWRCKTELVWKVTKEWYIAMDKSSTKSSGNNQKTLRQRMKNVTKQIRWIPEFGLKRELDWLDNMHDWLISKRNRYWGLCLPIWECEKCDHYEVIGSIDELEKRSVEGWEKLQGKTPHKPQIDQVFISCSKCGGRANRVEPVGNPWLDAGIVPFSTVSSDNSSDLLFVSDKKEWAKWVPADFITESFPGQFKNWFYSMIAMSTVLTDKPPYKTVLGYATALAEDGREMHKSWGNAIEFNGGADKIGVDVMRWMYLRQKYSNNLLFGYGIGDEVRRQFHLKIWNIYNYFVTYANLYDWKPSKALTIKLFRPRNVLDKWIVVRLNQLISGISKNLDDYRVYYATELSEKFVDDLSNWYVRRSRDRVSTTSTDKERDEFLGALYIVLVEFTKLMAPFMPYLSDSIYMNMTKDESVHLADWPKPNKLTPPDNLLMDEMKVAREVVEIAHSKRKEKNIPVRHPLAKMTVNAKDKWKTKGIEQLVLEELNVKSIYFKKGKKLSIVLDTKITPVLEEEAKTRDLIRKIQNERRNLRVRMDDRIEVTAKWLPENNNLIDLIKQKTLASSLKKGKFGVKKK